MTTKALAVALSMASVLLAVVGAARWHSAGYGRGSASVASATQVIAERLTPADHGLLVAATDHTISNDPFRLSNAPSSVRYDPASDAISVASGAAAPPPLRPVLILKAIVGGPPWQAAIDGLPGQLPGTLVQEGSHFDNLSVRAVTADSVVVQSPETTWVLSFRKRS